MDKEQLTSILQQLPEKKVWVIGDIMLDSYIEGSIERLSPEAPVQIVDIKREYYRPGGAANTAKQLAVLGIQVTLVGYTGCDQTAEKIDECCWSNNIRQQIYRRPDRPTIQKTRILSQGRQILRLDKEDKTPTEDITTTNFTLNPLFKEIPPDAIVLSDYCKGMVTPFLAQEIITWATNRNIPVIVDTKSKQLFHFKGATGLTPNLTEAKEITGLNIDPHNWDSLIIASQRIMEFTNCKWVIITLGKDGISVYDTGGLHRVPGVHCDAKDVTGAGDTVIAVLTALIANGVDLQHAVPIANVAGSVAVTKLGTSVVYPGELLSSFSSGLYGKIIDMKEIEVYVKQLRSQGEKIVFTNGVFDILHVGHVGLLEMASKLGTSLIVGINSDTSTRRLKGNSRPIVPEKERAQILAALDCVTGVVIFNEDTPEQLVSLIKPDILVKGKDYENKSIAGQDIVEKNGGKVILLDLVANHSTTNIVKTIQEKDSNL
jgi:D-beta-D-heptose 7-phosphate kinase/D-beta-D-heptose 1-phosphate adenosyltransferase